MWSFKGQEERYEVLAIIQGFVQCGEWMTSTIEVQRGSCLAKLHGKHEFSQEEHGVKRKHGRPGHMVDKGEEKGR